MPFELRHLTTLRSRFLRWTSQVSLVLVLSLRITHLTSILGLVISPLDTMQWQEECIGVTVLLPLPFMEVMLVGLQDLEIVLVVRLRKREVSSLHLKEISQTTNLLNKKSWRLEYYSSWMARKSLPMLFLTLFFTTTSFLWLLSHVQAMKSNFSWIITSSRDEQYHLWPITSSLFLWITNPIMPLMLTPSLKESKKTRGRASLTSELQTRFLSILVQERKSLLVKQKFLSIPSITTFKFKSWMLVSLVAFVLESHRMAFLFKLKQDVILTPLLIISTRDLSSRDQ